MSTYVLPQVEVFQDFETSPAAVANPLRAHISGPHAQLVRFAEDTERDHGLLGTYDPLNSNAYIWPSRMAGGLIDQTFTKLFVKDAILRYYQGSAGSGGGVVKVAGKNNQVRSSATNFKANGLFLRDASLLDRDVQVGDVIKVRFVPSVGNPTTLWSYVNGFVGDPVAAIVGAPTRDASNAATHVGTTVTKSQTHGPWNAVIISAANGAAYDPFPTGRVTEKYTIIVTGSSAGGDLTKATLRVISASGLDDQASVTPSGEGVPTAIGTHGLTVTFDDSGGAAASESAQDEAVSPNDLLVGQRWDVTVTANFSQIVAPTANAVYTGTSDTAYIITVVNGSKYASGVPQIKVTTTNGTDISGPTNVAAAGVAIPIGTFGTTATFSGLGLVEGDRFYVPVTAATTGAVKTIVLGNTIPAAVADNTPADITLFIRTPVLQVAANREGAAPLTNFDQSATEITVHSGITVFDATWTSGGVPQALSLDADNGQGYSTLYAEYRAWLSELCADVGTINDVGLLNDQISGALTPDNPLKWAVFKALENSNGVDVKYTSVCNPDDVLSWDNVLEILLGRDDVYGLVPLTRNATVLDLYHAHVKSESSPLEGLWRVLWVNLAGVPTIPVVADGSTIPGHLTATTSDSKPALATITDDTNTSGTQFTMVTVPAGNAQFVTNGVRPGDILRAQYSGDGFGNITYSEYVIDAILTQESLRLLVGPGVPINTPAKIEIWRNLNATEEATVIGQMAGTYSDRRVRAVWPDQIESSGTIQEGYHLCAALAGLRAGVLPHQGMTNLAIAGFTDVSRTTKKFNKPQLDILALDGTWIVTQSQVGEIYSRHAVTTGAYLDLNQREEMITSNLDSISFRFRDIFSPFIGVANVTPSTVLLIRLETISLLEVLKTEKETATLGGQVGPNASLLDIHQHPFLKDRIVVKINPDLPYPFNNAEIHLVVAGAPAVTTTTAA